MTQFCHHWGPGWGSSLNKEAIYLWWKYLGLLDELLLIGPLRTKKYNFMFCEENSVQHHLGVWWVHTLTVKISICHENLNSKLGTKPWPKPMIFFVNWTLSNKFQWNLDQNTKMFFNVFYPRPVLAFGYCRCLRVCVCVRVSVRQSSACPCNNSSTVQARITKFGPEMEKTLVKIPIILWDDWPWTSRSNRT